MSIWAMAKVIGRSKLVHGDDRITEVHKFALGVVQEALSRLQEFSSQALANIAWSLATLDLVRHEVVNDFFVAAATVAAPSTHPSLRRQLRISFGHFQKPKSRARRGQFSGLLKLQHWIHKEGQTNLRGRTFPVF